MKSIKFYRYSLLALTFLALGLRVWRLDSVPPGLRVDELSNTFVVSQHVLDGNYRFFFPDASGHEGLWHALQAAWLALFGYTPFGMRGVSSVLGTLTIPLTYLMGRDLYDRRVGLLAAAGMAVSFWSLMYSRVATRHISTVPLLLMGLWLFWRMVRTGNGERGKGKEGGVGLVAWYRRPLLAGAFLGLTLHTYFASWVVVAVTVAFCGYLLLFHWGEARGRVGQYGLMFMVLGLLALPVLRDMRAMPEVEEEGRINVVAAPLHAALDGDFSVVWQHVVGTFGGFVNTGDSEWLYNLPFRPIFSPPVAALFWVGILFILYALFKSRLQSERDVFIIFWWVAGLSPAFISVPPASLGHTIAAQPVVYIILASAIVLIADSMKPPLRSTAVLALGALVIGLIGVRDLSAYFIEWPSRGNVRFFYHGPIHDVGTWLHDNPDVRDFAISGLLIEPWDKVALDLYGPDDVRARWYNPQRAVVLDPPIAFAGYPNVEEVFEDLFSAEFTNVAEFNLRTIDAAVETAINGTTCFTNGLCLDGIEYTAPILDLTWRVDADLQVPERPLTSFPPIPGEDKGPRLYVFAQLLDVNGAFQTGDDGLWVDPDTLYVGDRFLQRHLLFPQEGSATIAIGLYDPATGQRVPTIEQSDRIEIPLD